ncbi:polysaccharide pyruvyl transferase family protein [Cyanobacterium aponinum]|uniref:polysaccharide pyruvyl transferase family protein n=1 Tax=Cyanobacterium aponinum TaxID=379064 RepID=UPI000C12D1EC|nr:polysaccharide pyruvyl transferase family protein [Cyanobacterium aponinum]PHV64208.1 hypothetical protein CSQ80_01545 [Cyanobacterium aponinum IPPAS B-1201]
MMKITYVSDNRTGMNWGCRATSIALSELLEEKHKIVHTIYRDEKFRTVIVGSIFPSFDLVGSIFPPFVESKLYSGNTRNIIKKTAITIDSLLGIRSDYVGFSPLESAKKLIRYKNRSKILKEIYDKVCDADVIVINGEGDLIFNPNRRTVLFLLMIIELANLKNKSVFFINAMVSDCPRFGRNQKMVEAATQALSKCKGIALRDKESVEVLGEIAPSIPCKYIPDALFSWTKYCSPERLMDIRYGSSILPYGKDYLWGQYDFEEPFVCLGGSSLATKNPKQAIKSYTELAKQLLTLGKKLYIVDTGDGKFLGEVSRQTGIPLIPIEIPILMAASILSKASVFISGRYHPSIMASLGGTPCIFLGSNSHKTRSLQTVLNYDSVIEYQAIPSKEEIAQIVQRAREIINEGQARRNKIQSEVLSLSKDSHSIIRFIENNCNNTKMD